MIKVLFGLSVILSANLASAAITQKQLSLTDSCLKTIVDAVTSEYGAEDETFSITGTKLLYGGKYRGLEFNPVVLVQSSDENEPRDFLVRAEWSLKQDGTCTVTSTETLADGLTVEVDDIVPYEGN